MKRIRLSTPEEIELISNYEYHLQSNFEEEERKLDFIYNMSNFCITIELPEYKILSMLEIDFSFTFLEYEFYKSKDFYIVLKNDSICKVEGDKGNIPFDVDFGTTKFFKRMSDISEEDSHNVFKFIHPNQMIKKNCKLVVDMYEQLVYDKTKLGTIPVIPREWLEKKLLEAREELSKIPDSTKNVAARPSTCEEINLVNKFCIEEDCLDEDTIEIVKKHWNEIKDGEDLVDLVTKNCDKEMVEDIKSYKSDFYYTIDRFGKEKVVVMFNNWVHKDDSKIEYYVICQREFLISNDNSVMELFGECEY